MDGETDYKLHTLKIVSDVLICAGTVVLLLSIRFLSTCFIKRCLQLDSSSTSEEDQSGETFVRNLCEIPIASWLYPIGTLIALIFLLSPEMKQEPFQTWNDWTNTISCIHVGHLITQIIISVFTWTQGIHFRFRIQLLHYSTACAINIICLSSRQMAALIFVGIVAQLPLLFAIVNSIVSKSLCPCLWTLNWLLWILCHIGCSFIVPGVFLINPLINGGIPRALSTPVIIALFWAISYFGILFLWELHRPFKALYRECRNNEEYYDQHVNSRTRPISYTENTPLVSPEQMEKIRRDISVP